MSGNVLSLVFLIFAVWLCLLQEAQGSYMMTHPQRLFCDADYVFKFRAMPMGSKSGGRVRRLAPGRGANSQKVEVERIYKGEKMMVPMMKLVKASNHPVDAFSEATKIEASIRLGMYEKGFEKNEKCVLFGKMFRYRNNTMKPSSSQFMMANMGNTMRESTVTKVIRRGLRNKYAIGCKSGCQVRTVYRKTSSKSKEYCDWNVTEFRPPKEDCCKTTQFCHRGKDGYCYWKKTKDYKRCVQRNKLP